MLQNTPSFVHVSHRSNATVLLTAGEFSGLAGVNMTSTNGAPRVQYSSGTTVHLEDNFERLCDILLCIGGSVCPTFHNMPHQCDHGRLYPQTFRQVAFERLDLENARRCLSRVHTKQFRCLAICCASFITIGFDPTCSGNLCRCEEREESTLGTREDARSCAQSAKCILRARQHAKIF